MLKEFFCARNSKTLLFVKSIEDRENLQIVRLKGVIDASTIPEIEKRMWDNRDKRGLFNKDILLDFKDVTDIDSATVAVLVRALTEIKHKDHTLAVINVTAKLKTMFEITKVEKLFSVFDSEKEAIRCLKEEITGMQ